MYDVSGCVMENNAITKELLFSENDKGGFGIEAEKEVLLLQFLLRVVKF